MKRLTIFISLILTHLSYLQGIPCQCQVLTQNDGFEGTPAMAKPPTGWNNCNDGTTTCDTQPGFFGNHVVASQGQTYISLVTRSVCIPASAEIVWSDLVIPFEKDRCYSFSVDLTLSHEFNAECSFVTYFFDHPSVLQVIGFNGDCQVPDEYELLWQSDVLNNYTWQKFEVMVIPSRSYQKIAFKPFFSPPDNYQNNVIFIDNIQYIATQNVFIHQHDSISLPVGSTNITWYFNDQVIPGEHSLKIPVFETGTYRATYFDSNGCFISTSENLSPEINTIKCYPNPSSGQLTLDFISGSDLNSTIYLYDLLGQIMLKQDYPITKGKNMIILDLTTLVTAHYCLVVKRDGMEATKFKIILSNQ